MSEKSKEITVLCTICGAKVHMTREEFKAHKNVDQYIIKCGTDGTLTAIQVGTLCDSCLKKPLENRVLVKK